jgi:chromosome partitioning protein
MASPVLAVLNMKGGVGKTTVSAQIMRVLYQLMNIRVLLLDLDAQFNLTQSVLTQARYDEILEKGYTIMSCFEPLPSNDFFQVKKAVEPPPKATEICESLRHIVKDGGVLDLVPGSFDMMKYSMIDDAAKLKHASAYFKRFMSQAKKEYDLVVLDCNPSSSFITKCALESSSHVLSPVKLDKFSILGVGFVDKLFRHLKLNVHHTILINDVRRHARMSEIERTLRAHPRFGKKVLRNRLVHSKLLAADPSYTGFAADKGGPYSSTVASELRAIAREISQQLGLDKK